MITRLRPEQIPFGRGIQSLCCKPYHKHPQGCPNFGRKKGCPPQPLINHILDFEREIYAVYTGFNVAEFAESLRQKYPLWSARQLYNPRYWQPRARKLHRAEEERARNEHCLDAIVSPEAHGVNVTAMMGNIGITLNWGWPPEHNLTYLVSLAGFEAGTENTKKNP